MKCLTLARKCSLAARWTSVRRPNHLRAEVLSDRKQRTFFYDGKTLTLYAPRVNYYASVGAPPTIAELLQVLDQKYGVEMPLADLFLWGTDKDGIADIKVATYIGPGYVGGVDCEHYAFRQQARRNSTRRH
jgi:hypothetical protein